LFSRRGLAAFTDDICIPLQYGVDPCVGDTICAGGILYGQRSIPVVLDFRKDIREVAATEAHLLNCANPMAMNTWAAIDYPAEHSNLVNLTAPLCAYPAVTKFVSKGETLVVYRDSQRAWRA
jgi:alpha-galactosidase/6-phospho-beta-glucosidase family protein